MTQERKKWKEIIEQAKTHKELLSWRRRRAQLHNKRWSLSPIYVSHSDRFLTCVIYSETVISPQPFKAQWIRYLQQRLTFKNVTLFPQNTFMCFVWISELIAIYSLQIPYRLISWQGRSMFTVQYALKP
jgi:hypothetical protein